MDWIEGLQRSVDYIEDHLTEAMRLSAFHQAITFSVCSVFFADSQQAIISEIADCRLQAHCLPQVTQK